MTKNKTKTDLSSEDVYKELSDQILKAYEARAPGTIEEQLHWETSTYGRKKELQGLIRGLRVADDILSIVELQGKNQSLAKNARVLYHNALMGLLRGTR